MKLVSSIFKKIKFISNAQLQKIIMGWRLLLLCEAKHYMYQITLEFCLQHELPLIP